MEYQLAQANDGQDDKPYCLLGHPRNKPDALILQ
jgi:hypothetical protein